MKRSHVNLFIFVLLVLVGTVTASEVRAFDSCRNVKFTLRNERNADVEIKKVEYYNASDGRWRTEDVNNTRIPKGQTVTFGKDDLQSAEGDRITQLKFIYKDTYTGETKTSSVFRPSSPTCVAEKNFGYGQGWKLTGSSAYYNTLTDSDCREVSFYVTNGRSGDVKFKKLKYYNQNDGEWRTENIINIVCPPGQECRLSSSEPLGVIGGTTLIRLPKAYGDKLTKFIFTYVYKSNNQDKSWSNEVESKTFEPADPVCAPANNIFGHKEKWTLGDGGGGSTNTGTSGTRPTNSTSTQGTTSSGNSGTRPANTRRKRIRKQ